MGVVRDLGDFPKLTVDLITGELEGEQFSFGILPAEYTIGSSNSAKPINAFIDAVFRDTADDRYHPLGSLLYKKIFKDRNIHSGKTPSSWLSQDILNKLQPGQCLRFAAYCSSKPVTHPTVAFTKYPNYEQYLENSVKTVYILSIDT